MKERLCRAREKLEEFGVDGIFLSRRETVRYLTGFTGSSGFIVITVSDGYFLTDPRYTTQAQGEVKNFVIEEYEGKLEKVFQFIKGLGLKSLGFEGNSLTYEDFTKLREALPSADLKSVSEGIEDLRLKKDAQEIEAIRKAIHISSSAFEEVVELIEVGKVEKDVALELEYRIKMGGADALSFDTIVASGYRTALPHGKASDKLISKGDTLIIDFGSTWHGYSSDETCTFFLGTPDKRQKEIFQVVKDAHDRAIEAVRPGVESMEVDRAARDTIRAAGYGNYFGHGTGHGVGLAIHEKPVISRFSNTIIEEGMVFTIEPGIYIPGWGGVRIEDMVLVTRSGCETLTYLPKGQSL